MAETAAPAAPETEAPDAATSPAADAVVTAPVQDDAPNAGAEPGADAAAPTRRSVAELVDAGELTIEDILAHPKVQGHVGTLAERQAREQADRAAREAREQAEARRLDEAAEADPDNPLAQERLRTRQAAILGQQANTLLLDGIEAFKAKLPKEAQAEYDATLKGKVYDGTYVEGMAAHLEDMKALALKHDPGVAKMVSDAREAGRREALAQANGSEPSPDLGTGTPSSGSGLTRERYLSMPFEERRKLQLEHPEQIPSMEAA